MKKFLAFTLFALICTMLAPFALFAQCSVKKQPPEPKFQVFAGASNSYGIDVKTKQTSVFVGGVAGIAINPPNKNIRVVIGCFGQSVAGGSAMKKDKIIDLNSAELMQPQTFSGFYFSIAEPIELSLSHTLYFGAVVRAGRYGNGMTFSPGFYLGYTASSDLFPKSRMLVKFEPAISLTKIENIVAIDMMINLRLNFRH